LCSAGIAMGFVSPSRGRTRVFPFAEGGQIHTFGGGDGQVADGFEFEGQACLVQGIRPWRKKQRRCEVSRQAPQGEMQAGKRARGGGLI
jgi:hypothetical protein